MSYADIIFRFGDQTFRFSWCTDTSGLQPSRVLESQASWILPIIQKREGSKFLDLIRGVGLDINAWEEQTTCETILFELCRSNEEHLLSDVVTEFKESLFIVTLWASLKIRVGLPTLHEIRQNVILIDRVQYHFCNLCFVRYHPIPGKWNANLDAMKAALDRKDWNGVPGHRQPYHVREAAATRLFHGVSSCPFDSRMSQVAELNSDVYRYDHDPGSGLFKYGPGKSDVLIAGCQWRGKGRMNFKIGEHVFLGIPRPERCLSYDEFVTHCIDHCASKAWALAVPDILRKFRFWSRSKYYLHWEKELNPALARKEITQQKSHFFGKDESLDAMITVLMGGSVCMMIDEAPDVILDIGEKIGSKVYVFTRPAVRKASGDASSGRVREYMVDALMQAVRKGVRHFFNVDDLLPSFIKRLTSNGFSLDDFYFETLFRVRYDCRSEVNPSSLYECKHYFYKRGCVPNALNFPNAPMFFMGVDPSVRGTFKFSGLQELHILAPKEFEAGKQIGRYVDVLTRGVNKLTQRLIDAHEIIGLNKLIQSYSNDNVASIMNQCPKFRVKGGISKGLALDMLVEEGAAIKHDATLVIEKAKSFMPSLMKRNIPFVFSESPAYILERPDPNCAAITITHGNQFIMDGMRFLAVEEDFVIRSKHYRLDLGLVNVNGKMKNHSKYVKLSVADTIPTERYFDLFFNKKTTVSDVEVAFLRRRLHELGRMKLLIIKEVDRSRLVPRSFVSDLQILLDFLKHEVKEMGKSSLSKDFVRYVVGTKTKEEGMLHFGLTCGSFFWQFNGAWIQRMNQNNYYWVGNPMFTVMYINDRNFK